MLFECDTCDRLFEKNHAAIQHMNALDHWRNRFHCQTCDFFSFDDEDTDFHMDQEDHWQPQFDCEACNSKFWTRQDATKHMNSRNHWRDNWCNDCRRGFQNANNLQQHLRGATHRAGSLKCPFCKRPHTTASGVAHHLETGSCPEALSMNRETIYKFLNKADTRGVITNKQLTWHSHENDDFIASDSSWNGRNFECYLCHRQYAALRALNQHLASPTHKQKIYHCFGRGCGKQFTALAALFNHLESESCGATRFEVVQRNVQGVFTGRRMLAF